MRLAGASDAPPGGRPSADVDTTAERTAGFLRLVVVRMIRQGVLVAAVCIVLSGSSGAPDVVAGVPQEGSTASVAPLSEATIEYFRGRRVRVEPADADAESRAISPERAVTEVGNNIRATRAEQPLEMSLTRFTNLAGQLSEARRSMTSLTYDRTLAWIFVYPAGKFVGSGGGVPDADQKGAGGVPTMLARLYVILDAETEAFIEAGNMPR